MGNSLGATQSPTCKKESSSAGRLWRSRAQWISLALPAGIYLALPTKNYYWDGVYFAQLIESTPRLSPALLNPNHLLYNVAGWAAYKLVHAAGFNLRALNVLQGLNSLTAALCVLILYRILHRVTRSEASGALAALFAFSGTWWRFATDADAYIPSVLFLVCAFALLLPGGRPKPVTTGCAHFAAMLFHQLAIFFFPVAVLGLWLQSSPNQSRGKPGRGSVLLRYVACVSLLTCAAYVSVFAWKSGSLRLRDFTAWLLTHGADASGSFSFFQNLVLTFRSYGQLFFAGRAALVRFSHSIVVLALLAAALLALAASVIRARGTLRIAIYHRQVFAMALVWAASYTFFLFFWYPQNIFYKLFALPALIFLLAALVPPRKPDAIVFRPVTFAELLRPASTEARLLLLAISVGLFNLVFAILPYSRSSSNSAVQFAMDLHRTWGKNTVVYYPLGGGDLYTQYFNPEVQWRWIDLRDRGGAIAAIHATCDEGRDVWVQESVAQAFRNVDLVSADRFQDVNQWRELIDSNHHVRYLRLTLK